MRFAFNAVGARVLDDALAATIALEVGVTVTPAAAVAGAFVKCQVRVEAARRSYTSVEAARLANVFGDDAARRRGSRSLLWAQPSIAIPAFVGRSTFDVVLPVTVDRMEALGQYLAGIDAGEVPVALSFAGTVFSDGPHGLSAAPLAHHEEALWNLPLSLVNDARRRHSGDVEHLTLRRDVMDRLDRFRARSSVPTYDRAIEQLLDGAGVEATP